MSLGQTPSHAASRRFLDAVSATSYRKIRVGRRLRARRLRRATREVRFSRYALDISETAIRNARRCLPKSRVDYQTADLLVPPAPWRGQFGFVFGSEHAPGLAPRASSFTRNMPRFSARAAGCS